MRLWELPGIAGVMRSEGRCGIPRLAWQDGMSSTDETTAYYADREWLLRIYQALLSSYGPQNWWPGDTPFEVIVGAVLTQNTAWQNVALAIANLKQAGLLSLESLLKAEPEEVKALMGPAGYFNVKYERLMNLLSFLKGYGIYLEGLQALRLEELRAGLLQVKGVGPETADSILLYAFERPVFVVDAYTRRLVSRLGHQWVEKASYDDVQRFFMDALPEDIDLYNEFHALIVVHCKDVCKKRPLCQGCCLLSLNCRGGE